MRILCGFISFPHSNIHGWIQIIFFVQFHIKMKHYHPQCNLVFNIVAPNAQNNSRVKGA